MMPTEKQLARNWHAQNVASILQKLETNEAGLGTAEVQRRQARFGFNVLPEIGPAPLWKIVLRQFVSPLIYILVAAAVSPL